MNQIFKVVFNAARGKKMVVNEATSSVQKGKMAAVTVAVAGALMLGANTAGAKAIGGEDLSGTVTEDPIGLDEVLSVDVNKGTIDEVISGHYFGINKYTTYLHEKEKAFKIQSTTTNVSGDVTVVEGVFGGSKFSGGFRDNNTECWKSSVTLKTSSTNLTIDGGKFGTFAYNPNPGEADCPLCEPAMRRVVTAADFVKDRGINYAGPVVINTSVTDANLTINGGEFDSTVYGGSVLSAYGYDNVNLSSTVEKSNVTITGGTFNAPVFAGGAAMNFHEDTPNTPHEGSQITSIVKEANLVIQNVELTQGLYTGGLEGYLRDKQTVDPSVIPHVDVETANVTVINSTISKIGAYNVKGTISADNDDWKWQYEKTEEPGTGTIATIAENSDDTVNVYTNLKIVNSQIGALEQNVGKTELRVEGENGQTSVKTLSLGDAVGLKMTGDGTFNDATGGDIAALSEHITVGEKPADETVKDADLSLDEGAVMGAVTAKIVNGEIVDKTVAVNDKTDSLTNKVTNIPQMITRIMMNDVRKRMGDIRSAEGTHGAWVRYNGGEMSGRGIENDFNMIQVGFDTMPGADAPRFGVAFSYANSEAEDGYGTADMDAYSLAAYATKFYDNGMFVDVIGRLAKIDTDLDNVGMTGKMDNLAVSLSGEFGWRFDVTKSLYVEPAVEATYTYMDSDEFTLGQGEYELESTDSFIGRAGIAAGFKCPANKGDVYVRAAVAHEFLGDATMNSSINGNRALAVELDGKDTWVEFGLGANFNVNESTYVYADVERTEGAAIDEDWRANVGVRFAF